MNTPPKNKRDNKVLRVRLEHILDRFGDNSLRGNLYRLGGVTMLLRVFSISLGLVVSVILARVLGPSEYGFYTYIFALISFLALPAQLGLPTLMIRETATANATSNWPRMKGFWSWSTKVSFNIAFSVVVLGVIAGLYFHDNPNSNTFKAGILGLLMVPIVALGNMRSSALRGLGHVVLGQVPESILKPLLIILFVGVYLLYGDQNLSAFSAMGVQLLSAIIAFLVGSWLLKKVSPVEIFDVITSITYPKIWISAAIPLALISSMQLISQYTDILMLGFFRGTSDVGIYKVAVSGSTLVAFGLTAINIVIGPRLARLHVKKDFSGLDKLVATAALVSLIVTLPVACIFLLWGDKLLLWVYGEAYVSGYLTLVILALGQVINALVGCSGILLNMTGYERYTAKWLMLSTGVNVLLNLVLIPLYGGIGAALATLASISMWNFGFWMTARERLGIDTSIFHVFKKAFTR